MAWQGFYLLVGTGVAIYELIAGRNVFDFVEQPAASTMAMAAVVFGVALFWPVALALRFGWVK